MYYMVMRQNMVPGLYTEIAGIAGCFFPQPHSNFIGFNPFPYKCFMMSIDKL